jgi:hypothetical protein
MPGKIFYRERTTVQKGEKKPQYRAVAVSDCNLKIYADHLRLTELEQIAKGVGAKLVLLEKDETHQKIKK